MAMIPLLQCAPQKCFLLESIQDLFWHTWHSTHVDYDSLVLQLKNNLDLCLTS